MYYERLHEISSSLECGADDPGFGLIWNAEIFVKIEIVSEDNNQ